MLRLVVWVNGSPYTVLEPERYKARPSGILDYAVVEVATEYEDSRVWVNTRSVDVITATEAE